MAGLAGPGCGGNGDFSAPATRADRPAKPPPGWRTVANRRAAFTIAAPKRWTVRVKHAATLLRAPGGLVAATVVADRGDAGRELPVSQYARETLQDLPDFDGSLSPRTARVRGSPYRSALVQGAGRVRTSRRLQRISVAALRVPGRVTYSVVAFRNGAVPAGFAAGTLRRIFRSLRAGVPR
ncbi:MAG: hypothetical protein ABR581_08670 [Thermoleophilaceae bacterium]